MKPYYVIFGPYGDDGACTYWNVNRGWVSKSTSASKYSESILAGPLPQGATSVIKLDDVDVLGQYDLIKDDEGGTGEGDHPIFERVF